MRNTQTVETWLAQAEAHRREHERPLVSLCYAQSLDGSITAHHRQPTLMSGLESSKLTHWLRAAHDAILVGVGTVLADNPLLTVRLVKGENPQPVILDSRLNTPADAKLLTQHPSKAWIATTSQADPHKQVILEAAGAHLLPLPADAAERVCLPDLLTHLAGLGISSLMVEGGAHVITSFLSQRLVDQVVLTIAPTFLGGLNAVHSSPTMELYISRQGHPNHEDDFPRLRNVGYERLGEDLIVWGQLDSL